MHTCLPAVWETGREHPHAGIPEYHNGLRGEMHFNDSAGATLWGQMQAYWSLIILCDVLKPS